MAKNFIISGFSDEISSDIDTQFAHLKKLGVSWFEPRGIDGKFVGDLSIHEAKELKKKMDKAGIRASSIGSALGKYPINEPFEPQVQQLRHVIEIAKILETNYIRVFSFFIPKADDPAAWREEVIKRMGIMAEIAAENGMKLLHENEGGIYGETAQRCLDIIESVNSPGLGCLYDSGNYAYYGYVSYPDSFFILKDKIEYFHIKDAMIGGAIVPAGEGESRLREVLLNAPEREEPYFLSLEPHLGNFDGLSQLSADGRLEILPDGGPDVYGLALDALKKILVEIGAKWQ